MKIRYSIFSARRKRFSPWRYGLKLGLAAAMIVWWWLQNQRQEDVEKPETRVVLPPDEEKPAAKPASPRPKLLESQTLQLAPEYQGQIRTPPLQKETDKSHPPSQLKRKVFTALLLLQ